MFTKEQLRRISLNYFVFLLKLYCTVTCCECSGPHYTSITRLIGFLAFQYPYFAQRGRQFGCIHMEYTLYIYEPIYKHICIYIYILSVLFFITLVCYEMTTGFFKVPFLSKLTLLFVLRLFIKAPRSLVFFAGFYIHICTYLPLELYYSLTFFRIELLIQNSMVYVCFLPKYIKLILILSFVLNLKISIHIIHTQYAFVRTLKLPS